RPLGRASRSGPRRALDGPARQGAGHRLPGRRGPQNHRSRCPGCPHRNVGSRPQPTKGAEIAMTTNPVGRLYDRLTPRERLPLLIAAARRGDEAELHRLQYTAPKQKWQMGDYVPHAEAFHEVVHYHLLTVLDLGMHFWQWWGLWLTRGLRNQARDRPRLRPGRPCRNRDGAGDPRRLPGAVLRGPVRGPP